MGRIVVMNGVTLDGVMQGPGRPEEDTRGGFTHGGWGRRFVTPDDAAGQAMSGRMAAGGGLAGWLFGRRTYEGLLNYWNQQPESPFGPMLNNSPKYVASTTLKEPLPWPNSTLLHGDIADAVGALKAQSDGVLAIMGSGGPRCVHHGGGELARQRPNAAPAMRAGSSPRPAIARSAACALLAMRKARAATLATACIRFRCAGLAIWRIGPDICESWGDR